MRRASSVVGLALVLAAAIASAEPSAPPLPIPAAREVDHIVLIARSGEAVITDAKVIEDFVAFLRARNTDWRTPWDTFPTPQLTFHVVGRENLDLVLWLGPNWLGGREASAGARDNRLRSLSEKDHAEALKILGATAQ